MSDSISCRRGKLRQHCAHFFQGERLRVSLTAHVHGYGLHREFQFTSQIRPSETMIFQITQKISKLDLL